MPIIPDLRKLSWEDGRFRVSLLHYLVNLRLVLAKQLDLSQNKQAGLGKTVQLVKH